VTPPHLRTAPLATLARSIAAWASPALERLVAAWGPAALAWLVTAWAPLALAQDVTGPALVDCSVAPATVDVMSGAASAVWTVRLTDDLSGVESALVLFVDPGLVRLLSAQVDASLRVAGDALDGVYEASFEVPEFAPAGAWSVYALTVRDVAGHTTFVPTASLPAACGFDVVSLPDTSPPTLAGLAVSPSAADVTLGPGAFTLTATLSDDRSGVDHAAVTLESPSGSESVVVDVASGDLVAGDALSGTYAVAFEIPQLAESGTWQVASVRIVDRSGFVTQLGAASLGIPDPPAIDVSSSPDTTPPELVWLTATPSVVYLGSTPPSVELRVRIRDDVTGLGTNGLLLESPVEGVFEGISFDATHRLVGSVLDGTYARTVVLDPDAPTGVWTIRFSIADAAGNDAQYAGAAIPGPADILVVAGAPPPPTVPALTPLAGAALAAGLLAAGTASARRARPR